MALKGLTVNAQQQLCKDGVRFRNIGLNYCGAVVKLYTQPSNVACEYTSGADQDAVLAECVAMKVKVLRIMAFPYWPAQWQYGVNGGVAGVAATAGNREAHYLKIDAFIAKCRALGIGVLLNLFFRQACIPDLAGQTCREGWLSAGATRTYAATVSQEIVTRYLNEEAVYGYEWGNEVNQYLDAIEATKNDYPNVNTYLGSRGSYPAADHIFKSFEFAGIIRWWYDVVRAIDPQRIMMTGNGSNTFTNMDGAFYIAYPMVDWLREQVRDNPTNCAHIHYYGGLPYGSKNMRGLEALLTGTKHWQKEAGRAFLLGEFGNQPWAVSAVSTAGGVATITTSNGALLEVGDPFAIAGTGTAIDGVSLVCASINGAGNTITASTGVSASFAGSGAWATLMTAERVARCCAAIISADVDVALFWQINTEALAPIWESVTYPGNEGQRAAILAANTALGW